MLQYMTYLFLGSIQSYNFCVYSFFFTLKKMSFTKIEADQAHVKLSNRAAVELNRSEISLRLNEVRTIMEVIIQ